MSAHGYTFPLELRGYARHEVDRLLRNLDSQNAQLRSERHAMASELAEAQDLLDIAQRNLNKAQEQQPNFAGLGSKFEEVLRLGEAQAEKMIAEAKAEAEIITSDANSAAQRTARESEAYAEKLIAEAEARAEKIQLSAESGAADLTAKANDRLVLASETLTAAKREAARLRSEAESEIVQSKLAAQDQIDEQRRELHHLREETEHKILEIERNIAVRQEEAEIEHTQLHDEALLHAQMIIDESNAKAAEANRRSQEVSEASEAQYQRTQLQTREQERLASERTRNMVEHAQRYSDETMIEIQEFSDSVLARTMTRLEQLRHEVEYVQLFVARRKNTHRTDAVIAELEGLLHHD